MKTTYGRIIAVTEVKMMMCGLHTVTDISEQIRIKLKKSLLNISKKKKCKTITPKTLPIRAEKIEEIMDYKCGFLDNEIDEIRIQFTPTVEHSQLWTCYIFYLICIAQLSDINNKDQQEFDTFINRIKGTKLKFGKNNEELLALMQEYKYKIFKLKTFCDI